MDDKIDASSPFIGKGTAIGHGAPSDGIEAAEMVEQELRMVVEIADEASVFGAQMSGQTVRLYTIGNGDSDALGLRLGVGDSPTSPDEEHQRDGQNGSHGLSKVEKHRLRISRLLE